MSRGLIWLSLCLHPHTHLPNSVTDLSRSDYDDWPLKSHLMQTGFGFHFDSEMGCWSDLGHFSGEYFVMPCDVRLNFRAFFANSTCYHYLV